jgi:hypothetical protein
MKELKKYWLWENEESNQPLEKFKELNIDGKELEFYRYEFELSLNEEISEDTTLLFKMLDRNTKDIFFVTGSLFCNLEITDTFKSELTSYSVDRKKQIVDSDEIILDGSDFKFKEIKGYLDHHYYFKNHKIMPLTEPNEEYFDGNGFIDTDSYGFLEIYNINELHQLITQYLLTK